VSASNLHIELRAVTRKPTKDYPLIGARWKPGHVVRRDTEAGTFCEINSPIYTRTEILVQRALLRNR